MTILELFSKLQSLVALANDPNVSRLDKAKAYFAFGVLLFNSFTAEPIRPTVGAAGDTTVATDLEALEAECKAVNAADGVGKLGDGVLFGKFMVVLEKLAPLLKLFLL